MMLSTNDQRKVLLIDHDSRRQHLRTIAFRNLEVEVHSASSVEDAAKCCTRRPYDLVLLATEGNSEETTLLSNELRKIRPRQRIAIFVGAPEYIREFGREGSVEQTEKRQLPRLGAITDSPPNQWRVMLEHLLAG